MDGFDFVMQLNIPILFHGEFWVRCIYNLVGMLMIQSVNLKASYHRAGLMKKVGPADQPHLI